jgi:uncharacterized iron-regulated membrane protein
MNGSIPPVIGNICSRERRSEQGEKERVVILRLRTQGKWFTNRFRFTIHGWLGIKLSILMFVICVSGAVVTVSHEIDWLINPDIQVTPQERQVSWGTLYDAVKKAYPGMPILSISAPLGPRFAAEVHISTPSETIFRVYVNPYTGAVQGDDDYMNVQRFFRSFHMALFLPEVGLYFVSFFGFVLLTSLITGVLVYKKFWRGFFRLRLHYGRRALWGDLHKLTGVWSLWFTATIAVTGIWYFVEMALFDTGYGLEDMPTPIPTVSDEKLDQYGPQPPTPLGVIAMSRLPKRCSPS